MEPNASITQEERVLLRNLAKQVVEVAALPEMAERRDLWTCHNRLDSVRPLLLVFPEGSWRELLPESRLVCEGEQAREWERDLRQRLYYREHILDDTVVEKDLVVHKAISSTGWGLEPKRVERTEELGSWAFDPVLKERADLRKLRFPRITHDETATQARLEAAQDVFGDILDVQPRGVSHISFHLMQQLAYLRGLMQAMMDMVSEPQFVHDALSHFVEGNRRMVEQYQQQNLLSLNNDGTYHSSGGVGYSSELPQSDCDLSHIRPCDMWASAESQELAQVSPAMHEEFALAYERPLLEPFGLTGYGCCEDLTRKLDYVKTVPNMRRISISPFTDVAKCAEQLEDKYIFSWKPHPAHLAGEFNLPMIRDYLQRALAATKGCVLEIVLKDTHTCDNHPERFTEWTRTARELVERAYV